MERLFTNIVIYCPSGISDTILATPVASAIKQAHPEARITWAAHPNLKDLLLTVFPSVDDVIEIDPQASHAEKVAAINKLAPDLIINLSREHLTGSFTQKMVSLFTNKLEPPELSLNEEVGGNKHIVDENLQTLQEIGIAGKAKPFPTIFPEAFERSMVWPLLAKHGLELNQPIIGVVPGVGASYFARTWTESGWSYLVESIEEHLQLPVLLLGGKDDYQLCKQIADDAGSNCINLAGSLHIVETAALLKALALVVGGDCGVIHMAVAAGTPVIGLYGPTSSAKRGPYGNDELVIDQHAHCKCPYNSECHGVASGAGDCMRRIMLQEVLEKVMAVMGNGRTLPQPARDSSNWFWSARQSQA
jgi:ADP-heptose:LPS heptosyltransferase